MALEVIGAGLGRNATLSSKLALEHIGYGRCYHMLEVFAGVRRNVPLWIAAGRGRPDWEAIFDGYRSTTDHPACNYWRELADYYPQAKVLLTVRDPDAWFDSVSETIYAPRLSARAADSPMAQMMKLTIFDHFGGGDVSDRAFMTDWYRKRNQEVIDSLPPERLLVFHPKDGWEPLCRFLGVPAPAAPFPRVNSRDEFSAAHGEHGAMPPEPEALEAWAGGHLDALTAKAFA